MWFIGILVVMFTNVHVAENRMLPIYYETEAPVTEVMTVADVSDEENSNEKLQPENNNDNGFKINEEVNEKTKKPCAIVVLSNSQNPTMQSLLRKYRYDAKGILIPSSVKYFIKMPQGLKSSSILVPLNDKAFSPLGGFVRPNHGEEVIGLPFIFPKHIEKRGNETHPVLERDKWRVLQYKEYCRTRHLSFI